MATVTVRYVPPDGQGVEERSLGPGEVLSIGRSPGNDGITLLEADDTISRTAIELELESGGVRVTNTSTNLHIELGPKGLAGLSMRKKESHIVNGDGWVAIRDDHLIEFKVLGPLEGRKSPLGPGPETDTGLDQKCWEKLHENYKQVCVGLVVAWFIKDLREIQGGTTPTNQQLGLLLGLSGLHSANKKIERTKKRIGDCLGRDFIGDQGKLALAEWVYMNDFVTRDDISDLPGLPAFDRD